MSPDTLAILQDFLLSRRAKGCAPSTVYFYQRTLKTFLASLPVELPELRPPHVRAYLTSLMNKGIKPHPAARAVRALVRFAHREGYIPAAVQFEMPKYVRPAMRVLNEVETKALLAACLKPRERAAISLLLDTGLRRAEACSLRWADVDFEGGSLVVRKGKGSKHRVVGIGSTARRSLLKLPHQGEYILGLRSSGLRMLVERVSHRAGLVGIGCHVLRRTAATALTRNGMGTFALQRTLGHASIATTLLYVNLANETIVAAHQQASPLDNLRSK